MTTYPATLAMPTEDRGGAHAFFSDLGFETPGELADDGVPEPLRVVVNDGLSVMLIPTGGFGWVTAGRTTADRDTAECLVSLMVDGPEQVDDLLRRAVSSGGEVASAAEQKPWGYTGTIADPDGHLWEVVAPTG